MVCQTWAFIFEAHQTPSYDNANSSYQPHSTVVAIDEVIVVVNVDTKELHKYKIKVK